MIHDTTTPLDSQKNIAPNRILNQPGFAGEYTPVPPMYSTDGKDTEIRCEHCGGVMLYPITEAAVVWYPQPTDEYVIYTGFHVTHKSAHCIDNLFRGVVHAYWMPFDTFYTDGMLNFDWFLKPRYDEFNELIDADLRIDMRSLDRISPVMAMLNKPIIKKQPSPSQIKRIPRKPEGYVYLVQSTTGAYKIGRTSNPDDRLKTFNVKLPFEVEYAAVVKTDDMYQLEANLHDMYSQKRINGEWFNLSPDDVEYIKGLAV